MVMTDMTAKDWFWVGFFRAMECCREDPDSLPHLNTLPREKACRMGFKEGVRVFREVDEAFMAPKGE